MGNCNLYGVRQNPIAAGRFFFVKPVSTRLQILDSDNSIFICSIAESIVCAFRKYFVFLALIQVEHEFRALAGFFLFVYFPKLQIHFFRFIQVGEGKGQTLPGHHGCLDVLVTAVRLSGDCLHCSADKFRHSLFFTGIGVKSCCNGRLRRVFCG